uniref:Uncharacterized protein n=1 Tax=Tanacetum cinerariifolium TaxID=118510 RepID=A0A6L2MG19_TANCI|nr:hypothetical protein [Tanacetum cinerariifolium]
MVPFTEPLSSNSLIGEAGTSATPEPITTLFMTFTSFGVVPPLSISNDQVLDTEPNDADPPAVNLEEEELATSPDFASVQLLTISTMVIFWIFTSVICLDVTRHSGFWKIKVTDPGSKRKQTLFPLSENSGNGFQCLCGYGGLLIMLRTCPDPSLFLRSLLLLGVPDWKCYETSSKLRRAFTALSFS